MIARIRSLADTPVGQRALDVDRHRLRLDLRQRLRGEHVLDLAGADAEGDRAEGAVRRGVRVAADDRHARLGEAELRADHVHDALPGVAHRVQPDAELGRVLAQRLDLRPGDRVRDRAVRAGQRHARAGDAGRRNVVVLGGDGQVRAAYLAAGRAQAVEGLRAGDLVDEVQVDEEQFWLALLAAHHMGVPDLLRERARRAAHAVHLLRLLISELCTVSTCISRFETAVSVHERYYRPSSPAADLADDWSQSLRR